MTTKVKAILGLGLIAGIGAAVLPLTSYADTNGSDNAEVRVTVGEFITVTAVDSEAINLAFDGAKITAGNVEIGTHSVKVSTSAPAGYTLTMAADHNDLKLESSAGSNVYDGDSGFDGIGVATGAGIAAPTSTGHQEATLATGLGHTFTTGSAVVDGTWGFRLEGFAAGEYVTVPTSTALLIAQNDGPVGEDETEIEFGVQAGTATPAGTYGAWITYVATTK